MIEYICRRIDYWMHLFFVDIKIDCDAYHEIGMLKELFNILQAYYKSQRLA